MSWLQLGCQNCNFRAGFFSQLLALSASLSVKQENLKKMPMNSILSDLKTILFHFLFSGIPYHTTIYMNWPLMNFNEPFMIKGGGMGDHLMGLTTESILTG